MGEKFIGDFVGRHYESNIDLSIILTKKISNHPISFAVIDACLSVEGTTVNKRPFEFKLATIVVMSYKDMTTVVATVNNVVKEIVIEHCSVCGTPTYNMIHIDNGCSVAEMIKIMEN